jgi:mRNA interferase YafQ
LKYSVFRSKSFKKAFKKLSENDQDAVFSVIETLALGESLERHMHDHALIGNFKGCRECHVKPDLLLIYRINDEVLELTLIEVGKHSELFG